MIACGLDRNGPAREARDEVLDAEPGPDPRRAARHGERDGLDEKLRLDVPALGADRHPHADLSRPLRHRDEHDVHDPDAAHEKGDARDRPQERAHGPALRLRLLDHLRLRPDDEVVVLARGLVDAVALPEERRELLLRARHELVRGRRDENLADRGRPHDLLAHGLVRGDDEVVLVLALRRAALRLEDPVDLERDVLDANRLADRILVAEESRDDGLAEHADLRGGVVVLIGEELAGGEVPRAHERPVDLSPLDRRRPVLVPVDDLRHGPDGGRDVRDGRHLPADRVDVVLGKLRAGPEAGARARRRHAPGNHHEEVRPEGFQLVFRLHSRAFADTHDGHDASDPDDDAERREERPQLVARESPEGDFEDVSGLGHGTPARRIGLATRRRGLQGNRPGRRAAEFQREPAARSSEHAHAQPASDSSRIFTASSTSPALTMSGGEMRMTLP